MNFFRVPALFTVLLSVCATSVFAQRVPQATPIDRIKSPKGFQVELLYSVPKASQGSWVNITTDPQGRLIVSDQYGGLYRVTVPKVGEKGEPKIEKIPVEIGEAQGLLWAFDSLYVMVNTGGKFKSGLYRVRDTNGNDMLDTVEMLRELEGKGEHGPHAIVPTPDGKSLYVVCGNGTTLPAIDSSRVPLVWDEDQLLPRVYGRGFMKGKPAPGGFIAKIDPDGKKWELIATGFRNQFDAAVNADGELFTFDADMEWDMNTPWYRPTRVCHVVSGAEFGWRNGSAKWPAYYPDSVPAVVNIGPGSPTGITFGYGAKFPAKYQKALFLCDWSYGKLYVAHLQPRGASYTATFEEFLTGVPLPLTDIIVHPGDGAMYFLIGGRRTKSGLYRVTYNGTESTEPTNAKDESGKNTRHLRQHFESFFHRAANRQDIGKIIQFLGHHDRSVRYAARVALEHQRPDLWQEHVFAAKSPAGLMTGMLALVRNGNKSFKPRILEALGRINWNSLHHDERLALIRVTSLVFMRMGQPTDAERAIVAERFNKHFPAESVEVNEELLQLLVYLQADVVERGLALLEKAPTQEEQIHYAKSLRMVEDGWTLDQRKRYFQWFTRAAGYRGGASFALFVQHIKEEAVAKLSAEDKQALKAVLEAKPKSQGPQVAPPRKFVKEWKVQDLLPVVEKGVTGRDFDRGRKLFAAASCYACHRFNNEGGAFGPDLTGVSGRFNARDLLDSLIEPSKVISDQYAAVRILTTDGETITGRIVNLNGDNYRINTNMLEPDAMKNVDRKNIQLMVPSKVSMMPKGLLDTLNKEEALDLVAYLLSRGNRDHAMFKEE